MLLNDEPSLTRRPSQHVEDVNVGFRYSGGRKESIKTGPSGNGCRITLRKKNRDVKIDNRNRLAALLSKDGISGEKTDLWKCGVGRVRVGWTTSTIGNQ